MSLGPAMWLLGTGQETVRLKPDPPSGLCAGKSCISSSSGCLALHMPRARGSAHPQPSQPAANQKEAPSWGPGAGGWEQGTGDWGLRV
mmetsp:Transcript_46118/g.72185  ORF Transcript_46118/g.72185 Transcript_46118/m.72185 type:complete len:88 (-) Transcript_46118:24-287(-)